MNWRTANRRAKKARAFRAWVFRLFDRRSKGGELLRFGLFKPEE